MFHRITAATLLSTALLASGCANTVDLVAESAANVVNDAIDAEIEGDPYRPSAKETAVAATTLVAASAASAILDEYHESKRKHNGRTEMRQRPEYTEGGLPPLTVNLPKTECPMPEDDYQQLKDKVRYDEEIPPVVDALSSQQVADLLPYMHDDMGRARLAASLHPVVCDPENWSLVYEHIHDIRALVALEEGLTGP